MAEVKTKHKNNNPYLVLIVRAAFYVLVLLIVHLTESSSIVSGSDKNIRSLFINATIALAGQCLVVGFKNPQKGILPLLLADLGFASLLVRMTGASGSPFLVLFPLLTLGSSVLFTAPLVIFYLVFALSFLASTLGLSLAFAGNASAILVTTFLGHYLTRALLKSSKDLVTSEVARLELENLQKAIVSNIPSGLISTDLNGHIIQINQVALGIVRLNESDCIGKKVWQVIPAFSQNMLNEKIPEKSFNKAERSTLKFQNSRNQILHLGYSKADLTNTELNKMGKLIVFQDVTEVIELENSLRTQDKLAAIGKLAAGIAHEIRNPLAGISGSAQLLNELPELNPDDQKLLQIIQRESKRLDLLIGEFLEYVKPSEIKLEKILLKPLITQVLESLEVNHKWKSLNAKILIVDKSGSEEILGEPNKIIQVVLNFIINSGQAGASIVELEINSQLELKISDNGTGISPENQKRLFEPFFTTKSSGTGLGLAMSYKILESMGAQVLIESPYLKLNPTLPNLGTCFTILFRKVS